MTIDEAQKLIDRHSRGTLSITDRKHLAEIAITLLMRAITVAPKELAALPSLPPPPCGHTA